MKIRLLVVGKPRDAGAAALVERYLERIRRFGVSVDTVRVPEVRAGGRFTDEHVLEREAAKLLARLEPPGTVVAIDRGGRELSSAELPGKLERWATPRATFVVGGPLGLHETVRRRADFAWSLSRLTLPHELALVLVAEQLYRGMTLLRGVPYHK
ncbi:MAG TPA: 23S rRNA (pseudouridine(1915)-N(3))-methyltransferase RlmH [Candidatus Polarisedimenticolaceae bacterium]|nr:23S rRNA (pseudouridine(1915)-N(3))-methyltransferase RlmH [Candidatus Polarisedimenticolaceae bacterium]